jgi:hypothetical protein
MAVITGGVYSGWVLQRRTCIMGGVYSVWFLERMAVTTDFL